MKAATNFRNGKHIHEINQNGSMSKRNKKDFGSINAAKRESRRIQMNEDGALGRGSVRVA